VNPDAFYLCTPDGGVHSGCDDPAEMAERAAILLYRHAWVEIRTVHDPVAVTRWTCLSRNERGEPESVGIEEFNGNVKACDMRVVNREL
jgi:hypothetical protein